MGLETLLTERAREAPRSPALLFEGKAIDYAEVDRLSNRVANGLAKLGVNPGDRVALMLPNVPEFIYVLFGVQKLGAVAVPFNTMYKGGEVVHILKDSGAKVLVALSSFAPLVNEVLPRCGALEHVIYTGERNITFAEPGSTVFVQFVMDAKKAPDLDALYRRVGETLVSALMELGASTAWYGHRGSLRVEGGKRIGGFLVSGAENLHVVNAQIFVGPFSADPFMEVLWVPMEVKDKVVEPLTSVEEESGARPDFERVREVVVTAVEKAFDVAIADGKMTRDELFGYEKLRSQACRR
ncbi:MAG: AMP-binding protein [Planctomycetota bacterium]|jgi:long-chain acyl-CoA synthetase